MATFEGKTPAERNKMIFAIVLGVLAVFALAYGSGLFSGSSGTTTNTNRRRTTSRGATQVAANTDGGDDVSIDRLLPVVFDRSTPGVPAAGRNIFAYYVPPVNPSPIPGGASGASAVTPPPTPTPPLLITSASKPGGVYARTGDFTLDVTGDKFTPETRVYLDNHEAQTQFVSAQQLKANVPASLIAAAGTRQVMARTPDGTLYSNSATLNVMSPPAPTHTYVGVIGNKRYNDKAILKDQKGDLVTVQLGDLVGGRFRITGISERAVEFTDQQLKIKHTVNFTDAAGRPASPASSSYTPPSSLREIRPASPRTPPQRQPAKKDGDEDDEETDEP
ncbi:MAG TPA: hypothetical protein VM866_10415 [Pyrinomonadaceae bacterium]|jgi:hypothetical protein|nr:hypothetical protein [Pyrinomonadaceae bacterium]